MLKGLWIPAMLVLVAGAASAQPNPSFYLVNRSSSPINQVFATPSGVPSWGSDRLGDDIVDPARVYPLRLPADGHCIYDLRVVYADGHADERRNLNTCALDNISFPPARARAGKSARSKRRRRPVIPPDQPRPGRNRGSLCQPGRQRRAGAKTGSARTRCPPAPAGSSPAKRAVHLRCARGVRRRYATERRRINLCSITDLRVP